jgi:hypothetical protein
MGGGSVKTGTLRLNQPHRRNPRSARLLVELDDDLYELEVNGPWVLSILVVEGDRPRFEPCPVSQEAAS